MRRLSLLLARAYRLAAPYGRVRLLAVLSVTIINGLFQVIGVSSIFPFFALAADPARAQQAKIGRWAAEVLPPMSDQRLLVLTGTVAIFLLFAANGVALTSEALRVRYAHGFGHWLRSRLIREIGQRPYSYFLQRNSGAILQKLTDDVDTLVMAVMVPLLEVMARSVTFVLLILAVILIQPFAAFGATAVLVLFYGAVSLILRPRARRISIGLLKHNRGAMISAQQFLTGIKAILVSGRTDYFTRQFRDHALWISRLQPLVTLYGNSPRYLVEPIAFGGMAAIVVLMAWQGRPFTEILPDLAVLTLAAYKLLPTVQAIYVETSNVLTLGYTLDEVLDEMHSPAEPRPLQGEGKEADAKKTQLRFAREISVDNLCFRYPGAAEPALTDISFRIQKNESVGVVGVTGSGKTTLVDLILGLHEPDSGTIVIDDVILTPDVLPRWRSKLGYVPQEIFLLDDTIAANIAFGVESGDVDMERVREAARTAQILDFSEQLPNGFQTVVGERGMRLSGGQRQRIGLARALYEEPEFLILDEATSSLDTATEDAIMSTIQRLHGKLTILAIAHRTSTLSRCDRIFRIHSARLTEEAIELQLHM